MLSVNDLPRLWVVVNDLNIGARAVEIRVSLEANCLGKCKKGAADRFFIGGYINGVNKVLKFCFHDAIPI